ncbi:CocE/NonD family hydrolase [Nonomuraea typhae]|uniref:CocE/NonD family hydrolase n=1 Tax=Nonomuraea typhae TaxID=2603600 RepID=A0ABW7ZCG4_9ACTN
MSFTFDHVPPAPVSPLATEHRVGMRDGVRLAADVYLPDGLAAPTEAVLVRLPYDKCGDYAYMPRLAPWFTARGYAVIIQDVRGKFRSEGEAVPFANEVLDGYDTIEWIVGQPWSNGRVGMFGDSYYGFTQWAAVASGHPALRAICPRVTGAHLPDAPRTDEIASLVRADWLAHFWTGPDRYDFAVDWSRRPLVDVFERFWKTLGHRSAGFDRTFPYPAPMHCFPSGHPFDARPVPTLQMIGWFDNTAPWQWSDHEQLARRPEWPEYLYIDAVDHNAYHVDDTPITEENDHGANPQALEAMLPRYVNPVLEFFEIFLRGQGDQGWLPKVRWRPVHGDWRSAETWPPLGAAGRTLYLRGGTLADEPGAVTEDVSWIHDPDDLVPSKAVDAFGFLHDYPDESQYGERSDVLAFTGTPTETELELAGPIELQATVRSSGPTMDVFARLLDVDPNGAARYIARGQIHVADASRDTPVRISLCHAGYILRPGHSLRLHLAGSDFPEFVPTPGTGENPWFATETRRNEHVLRLGGAEAARLTITVLP